VLHRWGSALTHHPHVHIIVPGGGISLDGERWISCRPGFFLSVRVLSRLFRRLFLAKLLAAHHAGGLQFFGDHVHLAERHAFIAYLAPLRRAEWVVYSKRPPELSSKGGGPEAVLADLSRYTHRVAISNSRLIGITNTTVTFKWRDYRASQVEGLPRQRASAVQGDDARHRRVHPPLPRPRPARRFPPHPALWSLRQRRARREHRASAAAAQRASPTQSVQ
jgi:hypothetical protein